MFGVDGVETLFGETLKLPKLDWVHQAFLGHSKVIKLLKPEKTKSADPDQVITVSPDPLIATIKFVFFSILFQNSVRKFCLL